MPLVDTPDTELVRKEHENKQFVTLYDVPVNGATPLDGAGEPMTSQIQLRDRAVKLAQGFTEEPVGVKGRKLETPKRTKPPAQKGRKQALAENIDRALKSPSGRTST